MKNTTCYTCIDDIFVKGGVNKLYERYKSLRKTLRILERNNSIH